MEDKKSAPAKKIYFASDFHLGIPDYERSLEREKKLVNWLDQIQDDAGEVFLMGDIFDFWFEYKTVVPKGFIRLLGKIAELTGKGIPVHLFTGNHDIWAFDYLASELDMQLHRQPEIRTLLGKQFYLAHGDGLGPGDNGYKMLKKVFSNRLNQWLFRWLHPDIGARMALYFSRKSRLANFIKENKPDYVNRIEDEMLYKYTAGLIDQGIMADYYLFGHRHLPVEMPMKNGCRMIILGDWVTHFTFAVFDGEKIELKRFKDK